MASRVSALLSKAQNHHDPDERYMAIRELTKILDDEDRIESPLQKAIRTALTVLLRDENSDVQANAVRLISSVVRKFEPTQVRDLVSGLVRSLVEEKTSDKQRENFETALKQSVKELRLEDGEEAGEQMVFHLSKGLTSKNVVLTLMCMDLLKDVVSRFGEVVKNHHKDLLDRLMSKLLNYDVDLVPVKAANTIGALVQFISDDMFKNLMEFLIKNIKSKSALSKSVPCINTIGIISREVGVRVGGYLEALMPALKMYCNIEMLHKKKEEETKEGDPYIQLWEACFLAFESFIRGCPEKIEKYNLELLELFMAGMNFDPNMQNSAKMDVDGDDFEEPEWGEEDAGGAGGDDWGDASGDDEGGAEGWGNAEGLTDSNDQSWKVRRQAAICVATFIHKKTRVLSKEYPGEKPEWAPAWLEEKSRFSDVITALLLPKMSERDDSVRVEVYKAIKVLIRESYNFTGNQMPDEQPGKLKRQFSVSTIPPLVRQRSFDLQSSVLGAAMDSFTKETSAALKKAILELFEQFCISKAKDYNSNNFPVVDILKHATSSAKHSDLDLSVKSLGLIKMIMGMVMQPEPFKDVIPDLLDVVVTAIEDGKDRQRVEGLKAARSLAFCINRKDSKSASALFSSVFKALKMKDVDQDVKDAAINAITDIISNLRDVLGNSRADVLPVVINRLKNSSTQLQALVCIGVFAASKAVDLAPRLAEIVPLICKFLRTMSTKTTKHQAVITLTGLVKSYNAQIKDWPGLISEVTLYINDNDMQLCALVLDLVTTIISSKSTSLPKKTVTDLVGKMLTFARSPLIQGHTLTSLVNCFQELSVSTLSFSSLLKELSSIVDAKLPSHNCSVVARCIASMAHRADSQTLSSYVEQALKNVVAGRSQHDQQLALLSIGDIGRKKDLGHHKGLMEAVSRSLSSQSGEIRESGSYALGSITAGNLSKYLPDLIGRITKQKAFAYLLFRALREVIVCYQAHPKEIKGHSSQILTVLMNNTDSKEPAVRLQVAECLGGLAKIAPNPTFAALEKNVTSKASLTRATTLAAVRFALSKENEPIFASKFPKFVQLVKDEDVEVRRQAVVMIDHVLKESQIMFKPPNAKSITELVVPMLYVETEPNKKYINILDAGSFKITEDHHLPLRRAAYDCLITLIDVSPYKLNMQTFYSYVMQGVMDGNDDIVASTWELFYNISRNPMLRSTLTDLANAKSARPINDIKEQSMTGLVLSFVKPKMRILREGKKSGTQARTTEAAKEILMGGLRAMFSIIEVPEVEQCKDFCFNVTRVRNTGSLKPIINAVMEGLRHNP